MDLSRRYRIPYTRRLFLWLLVYSLLLVGCFILFQYQREKKFKVAELNSRLQLVNTYIGKELVESPDMDSAILGKLLPSGEIRVTVIDPEGNVIYDNSLDHPLPSGNHLGREEIAEAKKYGSGYTLRRHSESTGDSYFYSATRIANGMIVRTAVPYSVSLDHLLQADCTFLWIMGGIALAFCVLGFFATRRVGEYIVRLKRFAERAERGETITDTDPFPHDELGDISNNIVRLYARLQQAVAERDRQHSMAMHQQYEKERIKKQLTNNINHELKTPVASIQVCLETLLAHENIDPAKRREFLEKCMANTERLRHLLTDVSLLTRMDDGGQAISMHPVDLTGLIEGVVADCELSAAERSVVIRNEITTPLTVDGNTQLLESVFYNLIDNALAYSGGSLITLKIEALSTESVTISVADNGCGVGDEHLDRLFERFYRVDKGRSRASGGTGLGLSIVKNAILLHRGSITVRNCTAGGLRFTISLPLSKCL